MSSPRIGFACGLVNSPALGPEIIAQDTFGGTDIFSLSDLLWRPGPFIPQDDFVLNVPDVLQFKNDFYVIGGQAGTPRDPVDTVWRYSIPKSQPDIKLENVFRFDADSYEWVLEDVKLLTPRYNSAVVSIDTTFLQC